MSSVSGFSGVYAVDWSQTAPGEEWGLDPDYLSVGMSWRWRGQARRLDAAAETLWLDTPLDRIDPRRRARSRLRRLALAAMPEFRAEPAATSLPSLPDTLTLTDGLRVYHARVLRRDAGFLIVFDPLMPPPDQELWISALNLDDGRRAARPGVICFLPGTVIDTPQGPKPVEALHAGDGVTTADNGAQPVIWQGETRLTGAELYLHPHLRPIRIQAGALGSLGPAEDLWVSPGHRLLRPLRPGLCADPEVLVTAEDLEDGRAIRRDYGLSSVRYVHLMLERHEILIANGVACESFHPALADPRVLAWHARTLERATPGLINDLSRYGGTARRCLDRGEAAILRGAIA